jgi:hypothetical protein
MNISEITLFNTLKSKLGEHEAQAVVEGIKTAVAEEFKNKKDMLATKADIHHLENEIEKVKAEKQLEQKNNEKKKTIRTKNN